MNADQWFAAGTLLFIILVFFGGRRAWREWTGWYLR